MIPISFTIVVIVTLLGRLISAHEGIFDYRINQFPSHLRLDSLYFGGLIPYFYKKTEPFLGFAGRFLWLLVGSLAISFPDSKPVRFASYLGSCSYSIYLWHGPVGNWLMPIAGRLLGMY